MPSHTSHPVSFHISVSRLAVNKTAAQILRRLPCQPPHCSHITHLNNAWWETGSGGVSDYTVFIPDEKSWPYSLSLSLLAIPQYFLLRLALVSVLSSSPQTPSSVTDPIVYLLYLPAMLPSFPTLHPLQEVFRILWIRRVPAHSSFQRDRHQCAGSTRHAQSRINLHAHARTHTHTGKRKSEKKKLIHFGYWVRHRQIRCVYAHEIRFCTRVLSEEISSPNLLAIKQLGSAFQSLLLLNVLFRRVAAETYQDSAVLHTHLQQTDNMMSVASGVPLNSAQLHYSLSFFGFRVVCVCTRVCVWVCVQICK